MADRSLMPAQRSGVSAAVGSGAAAPGARHGLTAQLPAGKGLHYIMGYIAAIWPNFAAGRTPDQKRAMIAVWEKALADIPVPLQKAALDAKVRAGQVFPPSSPAELRAWCNEIQRPMDAWSVKLYTDAAQCGLLDAAFCQRQIQKYEATQKQGRSVYAGWE